MKYTVGAYIFTVQKPFKTDAEAVNHVQERYPHLGEDEILKHLKPAIKKDELNQSGNTSEKNPESEKANPKAGSKSTERK